MVAPLRVARNTWSDEIHKWEHLKHLKYSIVLGTAGGTHDRSNLIALCKSCHSQIHAKRGDRWHDR